MIIFKSTRGEKNRNAKFTDAQVAQIKLRLSKGECRHKLAAEFKVSHITIENILYRKSWLHVMPAKEEPQP